MDEKEIREDERQACWEDFIQVLRNSIKYAKASGDSTFELTALHEAIYLQGWAQLGTGDGKPQHKRENSAVAGWTTSR